MSAYDKLSKQVQKKPNLKKRILTQSEDSDISERSDIPNVFLDSSHQYIQFQPKPIISKVGTIQQNRSNVNQRRKKNHSSVLKKEKTQSEKNQIQLIDDEDIPQGQQTEPNTEFSLFDSYKFYMGQITNSTNYPVNKIIAIDNNNDEQNASNRKQIRLKKKNLSSLADSNQYYIRNTLKVSFFMYIWHVMANIVLCKVELYLYLAIMIINFFIQKQYFGSNAQYVGEPYILLIFLIIYFVGHFILDILISKNRTNFTENTEKYKVYVHDGVSAEWTVSSAAYIKAGQIYKVPPKAKFPTDSILIHSQKALVLIDQSRLRGKVPETIFSHTLKQTIVKAQTIVLPISGMLQYSIATAQIRNDWFEGNLTLQEPFQIKHNVNVDNLALRESTNVSDVQILCMSLQVGSNSINLKNVQYPFVFKNNELILEQNPQIMTIKKTVNYFIIISSLAYLILSGVGILVGFLTGRMTNNHYYLGGYVGITHLVFYHFTNFVILIPIFVELCLLFYLYVEGRLIESNISKRRFQFSQSEEQNQIAQTIGKIKIKDYSILPYLSNPFTLVSGIELFKDKKSFKLKKILVKQTKFDFQKDSFQDGLFAEQQKQIIKYFMSVSLLTSNIDGVQNDKSFQASIKKISKQHFGLKINKQKQFLTVSGPLDSVFTEGKLQVIQYFTVKSCTQFPFSISFYEIPTQKSHQNPEKRILCLIRGDTETILMKAYGKRVNMLNQSDKLHQQQGYQMHFVGKFTIFYNDAQTLKSAYENASTHKNHFYTMLDPYLKKIQPMGLLAFENEFNQQNLANMKSNPFLNLSVLSKAQDINFQQRLSSQKLPNTIIIVPPAENSCSRPEFESVNTINRILGNPLLYNFSEKQIGDKILHDPIAVEQLVQKLNRQRVIIFNGWDLKSITLTINGLKANGVLTMAIIQRQEQIYLSKLCDYAVGRNSEGDISKYTDIQIEQRKETPKVMAFLSLMQLLNHDSLLLHNGIHHILMTQIIKFICYFAVEAVNLAYTLGTGITIVRFPLYILTQWIAALDVLFHLNFDDAMSLKSVKIQPNYPLQSVKTLILSVVGTLTMIYCSLTPHSGQGTPLNSIFCILHIHWVITHLIIFSKLSWISQISWYKVLIVIIQLVSYYVGILIISETSLYEFKGVISYLFNNKLYLVSIIIIWTFITVFFGQIVSSLSQQVIKKRVDHKYTQLKRVTNNTLEVLEK